MISWSCMCGSVSTEQVLGGYISEIMRTIMGLDKGRGVAEMSVLPSPMQSVHEHVNITFWFSCGTCLVLICCGISMPPQFIGRNDAEVYVSVIQCTMVEMVARLTITFVW